MARVRLVGVALATAALAVSACTTTVSGRGAPAGPVSGGPGPGQPGSTAPDTPRYQPPDDGSGYSVAPFDQPQPLPGLLSRGGCDWLARVKPSMRGLGAKSTGVSGSGCQLLFAKGEIAQVRVVGPYTQVTDSTTYLKPVKIAGVEARMYSFVEQKTDTICSVAMNPRSLANVTVDGYNVKASAGSFQAHCQLATRVATLVAHLFIPAAGGKPWPATPQQPSARALSAADACEVVGKGAIIFANDMTDEHPRPGTSSLGSTCDYTNADYGTIHVLLTRSKGGLKALPPEPGAAVTSVHAGTMPARTEQIQNACGFGVQFSTGQVAQLTYTLGPKLTDDSYRATTCLAARAAMSASLMDFMASQ